MPWEDVRRRPVEAGRAAAEGCELRSIDRYGRLARAAVFAIVGGFLLTAAVRYDAREAAREASGPAEHALTLCL